MQDNTHQLTRAFIALEFPNEITKEVARLQNTISNNITYTGKMTELENLHLTLKFLGEISPDDLEKVKLSLSTIKFSQFTANLEYAGTFSRNRNPSIVWLKIGSPQLKDLQKQIDVVLSPLFPKEERFMSHLTLARIKYVKDKQGFVDYIKHLSVQRLNFTVSSFQLKSSDLKPMGPVYTTLEEYSAL